MSALETDPSEVQAKIQTGQSDLVMLDCREAEELALAQFPGALHIPMGDIPSRLPSLDPEKEYIVFCHHGVRSLRVVQFLQKHDFPRVGSLRGGIDAWAREIDHAMPRYQ